MDLNPFHDIYYKLYLLAKEQGYLLIRTGGDKNAAYLRIEHLPIDNTLVQDGTPMYSGTHRSIAVAVSGSNMSWRDIIPEHLLPDGEQFP